MKAEILLGESGELAHKKRTVSDLIRYIKDITGDTTNYSVLLGAGCSVTSNIQPATELVKSWTIELCERFSGQPVSDYTTAKLYLESNEGSWYNPLNPYSSLFEKKYDLPSQRRRFVEEQVDSRLPSIGYAYLTALASENYINTIFTTNFDDLINEAFYQYTNIRPQHCAHDSSTMSISITSKRPKIIKLHGDYLFEDIKSTLRETESLEQNTKSKLIDFCREYGLIVVGYSGNDRSIMDVLEFLTKQENYLKNGIYWCLRKDDEVNHTLRNLLWKDKVYPVLIDGFDQFFAEVHKKILNKPLDLKSNKKESKLNDSIRYILDDRYNLLQNKIIREDIDLIKKNENSSDISHFIQDLTRENDADSHLNFTDVRNLLEVDSLIEKKDFQSAYEKCESYYSSLDIDDEYRKPSYIRKIVRILNCLDEKEKSKRWCEDLISVDRNNCDSYLLKSKCISSNYERLSFLTDLKDKFPYNYKLYNELYGASSDLLDHDPNCKSTSLDDQVSYLKKSLQLNPGLENSAWMNLVDVLQSQIKPTNKQEVNKGKQRKLKKFYLNRDVAILSI